MFAPRWPKNTSGSLPRIPPDPYSPAGNLVFAEETLIFQRSSVLAARSPKYALRKPSGGQLGYFLTPLEASWPQVGTPFAWPVRPSALPLDSSGLALVPFVIQLGLS